MKPACGNCQYYRYSAICSNSKSPNYQKAAVEEFTCGQYLRHNTTAPLWMKIAIKILSHVK